MKFALLTIAILLLTYSFIPTNKGVVKYYNEEKGFGYITSGNDELFVYDVNIIDEIKKDDIVVFDKRNTRKGWEAFNVRLLK